MSVPHTGHLVARLDGADYVFDGDRWTGPHPGTLQTLNALTAAHPKTHYDIRALADRLLASAGLKQSSVVVTWNGDTWRRDLEPGMID